MWIILAGVLMCYMIGFLLFCCYNTRRRFDGGDPENPSGSLASAPNARCRLGLGSLTSCLLYDEITQRNSDLPQSTLAAQREQQLRQIKLEINELSHRLGIGQLYRGRQYIHIPIPLTRSTFIQPNSASSGSRVTSRFRTMAHLNGDINYDGSVSVNLLEMSFFSSPPEETVVDEALADRNAMFLERERRLRLIRMEIEDLTLQLSSLSEDRSTSETHAAGCSISSSDLEGLVFEPDSDSDDEGALNSSSVHFDQLPSYDESIVAEMDESPPPSYAQCSQLYSGGDGTQEEFIMIKHLI